jgi:hypothetical protein
MFGALKKKTASEHIQKRFFVEVSGLESKIQTRPETLVLMISIAYFCRRSYLAPSIFGIFLGYD